MALRQLRELIGEGNIAPIHCDGHEILRRLFVTVRDSSWREVPPSIFEATVDEQRGRIDFTAHHRSDLIDFAWQGALIVGDAGRLLRFEFEGRALRDMNICRLGLVVLHPVASMIGARLEIDGAGVRQHRVVDSDIAPQPIVDGVPGAMSEPFTTLSIERAGFGQLLLHFSGDQFELEDQRNWGDASFKTYCTPLRRGFPRLVTAGTIISQSVEARFIPAHAAELGEPRIAATSTKFPLLGREWRSEMPEADHGQWDFLHFDTSLHAPQALAKLLARSSTRIQLGLDAVDVSEQAATWLPLLRGYRDRVSRILLYGPGVSIPAAAAVEQWQIEIARFAVGPIELCAATRGHYVEFNRGIAFDVPVGSAAFPLTATVHGEDSRTLAENTATIHDMVATLRRRTGQASVVIAPLAWHYPSRDAALSATAPVITPLVETWLVDTLSNAIAAGVAAITVAEDLLPAVRSMPGGSAAGWVARLARH